MHISSRVTQAPSIVVQWFLHGRHQSSGGHPLVETLKAASGGFFLAVAMLLLIPLAPDDPVRSTAGLFFLVACSFVMLQIMHRVRSDDWRLTATLSNILVCMMLVLASLTTMASHPPSRMLSIVCGLFLLVAGALLVRGLKGFEPSIDE